MKALSLPARPWVLPMGVCLKALARLLTRNPRAFHSQAEQREYRVQLDALKSRLADRGPIV